MSGRIRLDRAEFVNATNAPRNGKGAVEGTDTIYSRSETTRRRSYELWRDGDTIIIVHPDSGDEVHVPWAQTVSTTPTRALKEVKKAG